MKAVLCKAFGPPESLVVEEIPEPVCGPGQVRIAVHFVGINFPDCLMIEGKYQMKPPFPFSPGGELSGTVLELGESVEGLAVGQAVIAGGGHGGLADQVVVPARAVRPVPEGMPLDVAAAWSTTYGTSYHALKQRGQLQPGETLLVLGAAGGVGLAAVELGKAMGARVIAAASTAEKRQAALDAGADEVIDYSDGELKEKVKALTEGRGADVIYDPVGGPLFDQCMRCIAWKGRVLVVGFVGGEIPRVPINLILLKGCQVVGVFYGAFTGHEPEANAENWRELGELWTQGRIHPRVSRIYDFDEYAAALRCLSERQAIGKVVVRVREEA
ncbi:MAG: NADPH:quinone oxidoreductase family protein [Pseudomonadales bacterium]|jgi:NADPH2:quinone reductase|nr:NADPH:quinone oxidoreductase family protein [Pseudomonadales bacterium]